MDSKLFQKNDKRFIKYIYEKENLSINDRPFNQPKDTTTSPTNFQTQNIHQEKLIEI